jgi:hypothetical protein
VGSIDRHANAMRQQQPAVGLPCCLGGAFARLWLLLGLVLALSPSAGAVTYYLSSSTGDDSADGTSPASPWRSLPGSGWQGLRSVGDSLLLRQGDSWIVDSGDALVLTNASGTLGSYHHGNSSTTQPLIQVSSRGSWSACVRLYDATDLTVTGLRLTGCSAGVLVTQSVPLTKNLAIVNNVFSDIRGPMQLFLPAGSSAPAPWVQDWGVAVALATKNTSKTTQKTVNLTVANNAAVRIDQFYTNAQPGPGWNDGPMHPGEAKISAWGSRAGGRRGRFEQAGRSSTTILAAFRFAAEACGRSNQRTFVSLGRSAKAQAKASHGVAYRPGQSE